MKCPILSRPAFFPTKFAAIFEAIGRPIDGTKVATSATKISYDFAVTTGSLGTRSIEVSEGAKPARAIGTLVIAA